MERVFFEKKRTTVRDRKMRQHFEVSGCGKKVSKNNMKIEIRDEFIKLGQAMKLAGLVDEGVEAKFAIQNGEVSVNGEPETRRGRKLFKGDVFSWNGEQVEIGGQDGSD